jgi:hypothetical protein
MVQNGKKSQKITSHFWGLEVITNTLEEVPSAWIDVFEG